MHSNTRVLTRELTLYSLNTDARTHVLCLLCRLPLDVSAIGDCNVMIAVENVFTSLVDTIPVDSFEHEVSRSILFWEY